jgi:mono/diheme cytochrome c family protein
MMRLSAGAAGAALVVVAVVSAASAGGAERQKEAGQSPASGWTLAPDADTKTNPLTVDAKVIATGKTIYKDKCTKCHGPSGLGDGPDADPDHRADMDLTNPKRADRNPDGVVFYKVSNGRRRPKMPAFKEELTEQQIWSVVAYVQTLRKK